MSQFATRSSEDNGTSGNSAASFLKRLRQGVVDTVSKPSQAKRNSEFGSPNPKGSQSSFQVSESTSGHSPRVQDTPSKTSNSTLSYRINQFEKILGSENVDLVALRKLSWNGILPEHRTMIWHMMLGYLPTNKARRENALIRKRKEYLDSVAMYFDVSEADRTTQEGELLRQILVDLRRTSPNNPFFQQKPIQKSMERILYIWSIRHPASGYVQGMDDLLVPLLYVCMQPFVEDVLKCDVERVDPDVLSDVEADSYWCLTKLLDNIQDHYTFSQPGIQRMVLRLEDLVHRLDGELYQHFKNEELQFMQFSFRWMNCLLLRELPLKGILRLWDTYLAEDRGGFENFHVYVCVVILKMYKEKLMEMHFQDLIIFLQDLPTSSWTEEDIEPILSQAYILSTLFESSPSHLS